jgi:hypothetical protein
MVLNAEILQKTTFWIMFLAVLGAKKITLKRMLYFNKQFFWDILAISFAIISMFLSGKPCPPTYS